jgi:hypothetical protein
MAGRWALVVALGVASVLEAAPALGAEGAAVNAEYRRAIDEAIAAFDGSDFARARAAFERAHALSPSARTYRGIGITAFRQGDFLAASSALRSALEEQRKPLTAEQRTEVTDLQTKAAERLGHVTIRVSPGTATVRLDGRVVEAGREIEVTAGQHVFRGDHAGYLPVEREHDVSAGTPISVALELGVREAAPSARRDLAPAHPVPAKEEGATPSEHGGRFWTWIVLGAAPVLGAVSAGIWVSGLSDADRIRNCGCSDAERAALREHAGLPAKETWTTVTAVAAGVALAGGVVLYFVEGSDDAPQKASFGVGVAGSGLVARGTF